MMGVQDAPARLFHDFCLDEHVPSDHMLRGIDRHLDLAELRPSLKPFYSRMGRTSVDPELMMRMLIVGYCMGNALNAGFAKRSILIWRIAGSAGSGWTARTGMAADPLRQLFESVVQPQ